MNQVLVEVEAIKHTDASSEVGDSDTTVHFAVRSHAKSNRIVILVVAGTIISVLATDLRAAIDSATNVPR